MSPIRLRRPVIAACVTLLLIAAACTSPTPVPGGATGASPPTGSPPAGTTGGAGSAASTGATSGTGGSTDGGGAGSASAGSASSGSTGTQPVYADDAGVGAMARMYLRSSPARRLVLEIDYAKGLRPSAGALDHLRSVLESQLRKPGGITIEVDDEIAGGGSRVSLADLERLESRHRDRRSSGSTATMWMLYADGAYDEVETALGVAFGASSIAVFARQIRGAATALVNAVWIERSVLVHEVGHLLALVHIGYTSEPNREDPQHPHHSVHEDSVMYWAIEDISIAQLLSGGPPDDFDRFDRADLAMLRA